MKHFADAPRVVLSGIQPSAVPHVGNYLGALRNWVQFQAKEDPATPIYYSIADLHALTLPRRPTELREATLSAAASLVAIGINPERTTLFRQSKVPGHTDLCWILSCVTPMAWLARMTQWKSKIDVSVNTSNGSSSDGSLLAASLGNGTTANKLRTGLFTYPVLQAADVLLYKGTHVPVGHDQKQHIELANNIAKLFNREVCSAHGAEPIFPAVKPILSRDVLAQRVMSLTNPAKKMSKSDPKKHSRIDITDTPEAIAEKVRRAVTDSNPVVGYNPEERPGVANLITLYAIMNDIDIQEAATHFEGKSGSQLKTELTETMVEFLSPFRVRYNELMRGNSQEIIAILERGEAKAAEIAQKNLSEIKERCGFLL